MNSTNNYTPHEIESLRILKLASVGQESIIHTPKLAGDCIIMLAIRVIKERKLLREEEEYTVMRNLNNEWVEP